MQGDSPFTFRLMPLTDTVMIDRDYQHLNVSLPQPVNYSNLIVHSIPLNQASAPPLMEPPNSIKYTEIFGRDLKREETKANLAFNKHYNNKVHPIEVRSLNQNGESVNNNLNINAAQKRKFQTIKIIIAISIALITIAIIPVIILGVVNQNKSITITNNNSTVYTQQIAVNCYANNCGCSYSPCMNGGVCKTIGSSSYSCSCPLYYSGTNCQIYYNPCSSNPCQNGGSCYTTAGNSFTCSCRSGFSGSYCQAYNSCYYNLCLNGATCSAIGSKYVCLCPYFYSGTYCQVWIIG